MYIEIYQVDSFTNKVFSGNPACVVPLKNWLPDDVLLNIARENAVAETAFFIINEDHIHLRWFTPDLEIDLCGHATLATAHVLKSCLKHSTNEIKFKTISGNLSVTCKDDFYYMNFPARIASPAILPKEIEMALNIPPREVYKSRDYMLVYENENDIKEIKINRHFFDNINLGHGGVIVTSKGESSDFVSRFFTPQATILEDPVTGSSHCTLIPYWSNKLFKDRLTALQISERGGLIHCHNMKNRVIIGGQAQTYLKGKLLVKF